MKVLHIVGARPNFMKIAPIMREMAQRPAQFEQALVHTGQHYDANMSQVFFDELALPHPDVNLEVGSGSHAWQTAQVMTRFEPVLLDFKPDWVLVPGDVNSTLACALVAAKLGVKVAHVEAGLRSFDRTMPEEINRVLTDHLSDLLLTSEPDGNENLAREGIPADKVHFVGNVMIDTLVRLLPQAEARWPELRRRFDLDRYMLVTLHRPGSVDEPETLGEILAALHRISRDLAVVFPVHPRTRARIAAAAPSGLGDRLRLTEPLGYLDFVALQAHAALILTDSGGIQEESTYLGVPCLTVRPNTERPVTITMGTNRLIAGTRAAICDAVAVALAHGRPHDVIRPPLWDGCAAPRIVAALQKSPLNRSRPQSGTAHG